MEPGQVDPVRNQPKSGQSWLQAGSGLTELQQSVSIAAHAQAASAIVLWGHMILAGAAAAAAVQGMPLELSVDEEPLGLCPGFVCHRPNRACMF